MKRLSFFIFFIGLFYLSVSFVNAQSVISNNPVTIIGDSLSVGAASNYSALLPNADVHAEISKPWSWGISQLTTLKNSGQLKPTLVFELGTNNASLGSQNIDELLQLASGSQVILVTIYDSVDPSRVNAINPVFQQAAAAHPDQIKLVDWNADATAHPEWFGADGVHPNAAGSLDFATIIAQAVAGTSSSTPASGSPRGGTSYYSESNTVTTIIGNGVVTGGNSDIVSWAQKINAALEVGQNGSYNRMESDISNNGYSATKASGNGDIYWCTYLTVDSYNLASIKGPKLPDHAAVVNLVAFWKTTSGFKYLDYLSGNHQTVLQQVQPGYAIFFKQSPLDTREDLDHTAIVQSITIDSQGNGNIQTIDSNLSVRALPPYPIHNWNIEGYLPQSPPEGFGGV